MLRQIFKRACNQKKIRVMEKEQEGKSSNFVCFNCNKTNFFDKAKYKSKETPQHKVEGVEIKCKICREVNYVTIEFPT